MHEGRWPLVGRDDAVDAIVGALEHEPARSLVLAGPAGVGRTRLAREALAFAEREGRRTLWAAGTAAAARVPLGALAHLLPAFDAGHDTLALLQQATQAIAGDGTGPPPVLGVDDVHLLDQLSVTLLHQLVARGAVALVLTVRTGNGVQDPVAALWKDGLANRIELQPLQRSDTERLIASAVDGDVETRTVERLWRLSRGNPLYLWELVLDGQRTGSLRRSGGLWRWEGAMVPSQRLAEIVLAQLGDLDAAEWRALQVLATVEPLDVEQVVELSSADAVASLEWRGVVVDDHAEGAGGILAWHPLYTEVVRSRVPKAVLQHIRRQLAEGQASGDSGEHVLRRAVALLDSGVPARDAELLTEGARHALTRLDLHVAERLARAAIESGGGFTAHLAQVEAVRWEGQPERAMRLAVTAAPLVGSDDDRSRLAATRALTLFCALGEAGQASRVLSDVGAVVQDGGAMAVLTATEAMLAFLGGDSRRSVELGTAVLSSPSQGGAAQPLAAAAAAAGLAVTGRGEQALAMTDMGWLALASQPEPAEPTFARLALAQAEILALSLDGRIRELERRVAELHRRNLATTPEWVGDAVACFHCGWAAVSGGRPRAAIRWLTEALAGFERQDPAGMLAMCRSTLALAKALVGDVPGARQLVNAPRADCCRGITAFDPMRLLAEAWLAAAEGRSAQGGGLALDAAALAGRQGQWAVEAVLLHHALRLGRDTSVVHRLQELAERLDSPFVADIAGHARAAVAAVGEPLDLVSTRFEEAGALLFAADAAAEAAAAYERFGARREATAAFTRAATLARECGLAQAPALDLVPLPALTEREHEVARLASVGLSNQAIADKLVVSVRTVEAHLAHVYEKLGIKGRVELAASLVSTTVGGRRERNGGGRLPGLPAARRWQGYGTYDFPPGKQTPKSAPGRRPRASPR